MDESRQVSHRLRKVGTTRRRGTRGAALQSGLAAFLVAAAATGGLLLPAAEGAAQEPESVWTAPRWVGDATFLSTNALLGGLTAGVLQKLEGGDFRDGFTRGALGGATAYAGRRVAAQRFDGAGLLGRQISGVGASMVRNAGDARPLLERLVFPVGPVQFHVDRSDGLQVRPSVSAREVGWLLAFALRSETEMDWSASLSAGAPVFRSPFRAFEDRDGEPLNGIHVGGVIGLSDVPEDLMPSVFAHERVHVLQHDFADLVWSDPLESRLLAQTELTRTLARHLHLGVAFPALRNATFRVLDVDRSQQPGEIEARFLDRRRRP